MKEENQDIIKVESNFIIDIKSIIDQGRQQAYASVSRVMIDTYWKIGERIVMQEQKGKERADYGTQLIAQLSEELTHSYGKGFSRRNLQYFRAFYLAFNDLEIVHTHVHNLTWSHIRTVLRVEDPTAARWYMLTASQAMWSVSTLDRNISTQYFERHFKSPELPSTSSHTVNDKFELLKSPIIAEFLGFKKDDSYSESQLESAIITHLQEFIMEMGRGFAFMGRQEMIRTAQNDYFIDLVFYNVILKCYVLIDLKIGKITHQDVGQMDMYVRMYDELKRTEGDNPTIGIVLCSETDEDIAKYSILKGNEQLFATKYKTYLPTEKELKREIERQKLLFEMQNK